MRRTWWAALALLAIFAMHGLASHAPLTPVAALDGEGHDGGLVSGSPRPVGPPLLSRPPAPAG